jgi:hypothetical protein
MNAGPDVERLIADWLDEEAPVRAPDRILGSAAKVIDRTRQRRFTAAWRQPMTFSIARLVAVLAIVVIVVGGGAAWLGRSTAGLGGPNATPAPPSISPSPTPSGPTLQSYRAARDALCTPLTAQIIALNDQAGTLHPDTDPADLPASIANLEQVIANGEGEIASLATLTPPAAVAADHAADVTHHRDSIAILNEALAKLRLGKVAEASAIADATRPLSGVEQDFEAKYGLAGCP